jgi:hypothetical protein
MEQEEAGQPPRRLVGIDLGIASRHSVRVLEADGQVVCRSSCVPAAESLAAVERAALAGASAGTTLAVVSGSDRSGVAADRGVLRLFPPWPTTRPPTPVRTARQTATETPPSATTSAAPPPDTPSTWTSPSHPTAKPRRAPPRSHQPADIPSGPMPNAMSDWKPRRASSLPLVSMTECPTSCGLGAGRVHAEFCTDAGQRRRSPRYGSIRQCLPLDDCSPPGNARHSSAN